MCGGGLPLRPPPRAIGRAERGGSSLYCRDLFPVLPTRTSEQQHVLRRGHVQGYLPKPKTQLSTLPNHPHARLCLSFSKLVFHQRRQRHTFPALKCSGPEDDHFKEKHPRRESALSCDPTRPEPNLLQSRSRDRHLRQFETPPPPCWSNLNVWGRSHVRKSLRV